jgi:putative transposase
MSVRRLERWKAERERKQMFKRNVRPYNALTEVERQAVAEIVADPRHADESMRGLSVRLMEERGVYVSHVSLWGYERSIGVNGHRGHRRNQRERPEKPDTDFATGPNQLWSWDITKLRTPVAYVFFYLVAILDTWSRKAVGWLVSNRATSEEVQWAWDIALEKEQLIYARSEDMPKSLSDRGTQMRSVSTGEFFKKIGVERLFARPRTPNDNAKCEALFSTIKTAPAYPGLFERLIEGVNYFDIFFQWYHCEHLHTSLEMMTPEDWHTGRYVRIREQRNRIKQDTFARRRAENLGTGSIKNKTKNATFLD